MPLRPIHAYSPTGPSHLQATHGHSSINNSLNAMRSQPNAEPNAHPREPIYLDYAATTPVLPAVAEVMQQAMQAPLGFANPSSGHFAGRQLAAQMAQARNQVAALMQAQSAEIIFTSGATEANNLAIRGAAQAYAARGKHLITSSVEHKAVLDVFRALECEGFAVSYLQPNADGQIPATALKAALREDTILVSLMHVNNELGCVNDLNAYAELLAEHPAKWHVDAAQSIGKLALDVSSLPVDYVSLSAHKFGGPKGVGALFVRRRPRARLQAQQLGGGQEQGLRAGTLASTQILGLAKAAELALAQQERNHQQLRALHQQATRALSNLPGVSLNMASDASAADFCPHILSFSVSGLHGAALALAFDLAGLALSQGSACMAAAAEPSHVLKALGFSASRAEATFRLSFAPCLSAEQLADALERIAQLVVALQAIAQGEFMAEAWANGLAFSRDEIASSHWLPYFAAGQGVSKAKEQAWVVELNEPAQGDQLILGITLQEERLQRFCWQGALSPAVMATLSWCAEHLPGKTVAELARLPATDLLKALNLPVQQQYAAVFVLKALNLALTQADAA